MIYIVRDCTGLGGVCVLPCTYMANAFYGDRRRRCRRRRHCREPFVRVAYKMVVVPQRPPYTVAAVDPARTSATGSYIILFELLDDACRLG
jgi:hypothetical protein